MTESRDSARAAPARASGRRTRRWTPAPASSRRRRRTSTRRYDEENEARAERRPDGGDPGQRAQPDRAGRRVRLLLRARRDGVPRAGLPHGHGQLQSRDGLHRLRHLRRALLRAAHARGRARDRGASSSRSAWWCSSAGRRRSGWRAGSSARACAILGTSPEAIDLAEDRGRFEAIARELGVAQPPSGVAHSVDEAVARRGAGRLSGAGAAVLRAGRPRDGDRLRRRVAAGATSTARRAWRPSTRC